MKRKRICRAAFLLAMVLLLSACAQPVAEPVIIPESTKPILSKPIIVPTEPDKTEPSVPVPTIPEPTTPEPTIPEPTVPEPTIPEPTIPEPTIPEPTVPKPTQPKPTTPKPTRPKPQLPDPDPSGVKEITLSFVGDCTFGRNQKHTYGNSFTEMYDQKGPDYFLKNVRDIFENDDITVINLEGSLTTSTDIQDKTWNHKGDPEYVKIMTGSSVEVATMGNNHRLDYGQSGCDETEQVLIDAGIGYCYDDIYLIQQVKGIRVGFVSVNVVYDGSAVEKWLTEGYQYLRKQGCSIVVACVHWGMDKTPELSSYQKTLGYKLIDMGYDLVVGNHPHVLQATQVYKGKFICYSLGNFCYGGNKNPDDKDSGIFQQTFTLVDGQIQNAEARFIPCRLSGVDSRNNYQPTPVTGAEYQRIIAKMNSYSQKFGFLWGEDGAPARMEDQVAPGHTHRFTAEGAAVPPTCTEQGYRNGKCICGEVGKTELTPALGHQCGEFISNGDATCTADGTKTAQCAVCGERITEPDPGTAGHQYVATEVIPPTADAQGYTTYTCAVCGDSYQDDFTEYVPEPEQPEPEQPEPEQPEQPSEPEQPEQPSEPDPPAQELDG